MVEHIRISMFPSFLLCTIKILWNTVQTCYAPIVLRYTLVNNKYVTFERGLICPRLWLAQPVVIDWRYYTRSGRAVLDGIIMCTVRHYRRCTFQSSLWRNRRGWSIMGIGATILYWSVYTQTVCSIDILPHHVRHVVCTKAWSDEVVSCKVMYCCMTK